MSSFLLIIISLVSSGDILKQYSIDTEATIIEKAEISNIKPTLKEYLSDLPHIYERLEEIHMNDIDVFIHKSDRELDILSDKYRIATTIFDKIKFKTAMKALRTDLAPSTSRQSAEISNEAKKTADAMKYAYEETADAQQDKIDNFKLTKTKQSSYENIQNEEPKEAEHATSVHSLAKLILLAVIGVFTVLILWCWWRISMKSIKVESEINNSKSKKTEIKPVAKRTIPAANAYDIFRLRLQRSKPVKIALKYHSHRKKTNGWTYHPRNLLNDDGYRYLSEYNSDFSDKERDWIIFEIKQGKGLYLPTSFNIMNADDHWGSAGVKQMTISIGDGDYDWVPFGSSTINVSSSSDLQKFSINVVPYIYQVIKRKKFKYIKLEFIENHGNTESRHHRFAVQKFDLFGVSFR